LPEGLSLRPERPKCEADGGDRGRGFVDGAARPLSTRECGKLHQLGVRAPTANAFWSIHSAENKAVCKR